MQRARDLVQASYKGAKETKATNKAARALLPQRTSRLNASMGRGNRAQLQQMLRSNVDRGAKPDLAWALTVSFVHTPLHAWIVMINTCDMLPLQGATCYP